MSGHTGKPGERERRTETPDLVAVVEEYEDARDHCTLYPAETSSVERMSTWLTGVGDAFVSREEMR
jgi:hypothetical protein